MEPITSNEELERFASFTEAVRDALGESGRIKELRPDEAAERGCLSTLRSLHRRGRAELTVNLCTSAAKGGQLEVLEWLRENECPWDKNTCKEAAYSGHLEVLQWARENDCPWDENTCRAAAYGGHLEVLQWARENGCPWNEDMRAASGGQEARENGCPWDEDTCKDAGRPPRGAAVGARENDCPWKEDTCGTSTAVGRRPRRGAAVGARERLPVERGLQWRARSGRARTAARGGV